MNHFAKLYTLSFPPPLAAVIYIIILTKNVEERKRICGIKPTVRITKLIAKPTANCSTYNAVVHHSKKISQKSRCSREETNHRNNLSWKKEFKNIFSISDSSIGKNELQQISKPKLFGTSKLI